METREATRNRERMRELAAAALRAQTGGREFHFRGEDVWEGTARFRYPGLHLHADPDAALSSLRGVADGIAARLIHSNADTHEEMKPPGVVAGTIFDVLEQLRTESLASAELPGTAHNIRTRFEAWTREFMASGMSESQLGMLVFTTVVTARARIFGSELPADLEDIMEHTRITISGATGPHMKKLRPNRFDQRTFGDSAARLSVAIAELAQAAIEADGSDGQTGAARGQRFALFEREDEAQADELEFVSAGASKTLHRADGAYAVFTTEFDEVVRAVDLVPTRRSAELREHLDELIDGTKLSARRLARQLQAVLGVPSSDGWLSAQEQGIIDGRLLPQLVATPSSELVFKTSRPAIRMETSLTILVDCSGSMRPLADVVAPFLAIVGNACGLSDIDIEILGFSTRSWSGGRAAKLWKKAGSPSDSGRVAELRLIEFSDFAHRFRVVDSGLTALMRRDLYKEGLDGEALEWACNRAMSTHASHRMVVVVSDGSPSEAGTAIATDENYLGAHLRQIVDRWNAVAGISVGGLGLGLDLSYFYDQHVSVELAHDGAANLAQGLLALISKMR